MITETWTETDAYRLGYEVGWRDGRRCERMIGRPPNALWALLRPLRTWWRP